MYKMSSLICNNEDLKMYINKCNELALNNNLSLKLKDEIINDNKDFFSIQKADEIMNYKGKMNKLGLMLDPVQNYYELKKKSKKELLNDIQNIRRSKVLIASQCKLIDINNPVYKKPKIHKGNIYHVFCCCGCTCLNLKYYERHINNKSHKEYMEYHLDQMNDIDKTIFIY